MEKTVLHYNAKHHHRGQAHKHVRKRRQDDRRRTNRTQRVGALLLMPSCLGIGGHTGGSRQGQPRYTSGTPVRLRREAVVHNKLQATPPTRQDQGHSAAAPWLPTGSVKEQDATQMEDKKRFVTFALTSVNHSTIHRTRTGKKKKHMAEDRAPRILGQQTKPSVFLKKDRQCNYLETMRFQGSGSTASVLWS